MWRCLSARDPARAERPKAHHLRSVSCWRVTTPRPIIGAAPAKLRKSAICPDFHAAIELIGKRWSGAILSALGEGPLRFGELGQTVPGMSDRLLSERLRE